MSAASQSFAVVIDDELLLPQSDRSHPGELLTCQVKTYTCAEMVLKEIPEPAGGDHRFDFIRRVWMAVIFSTLEPHPAQDPLHPDHGGTKNCWIAWTSDLDSVEGGFGQAVQKLTSWPIVSPGITRGLMSRESKPRKPPSPDYPRSGRGDSPSPPTAGKRLEHRLPDCRGRLRVRHTPRSIHCR